MRGALLALGLGASLIAVPRASAAEPAPSAPSAPPLPAASAPTPAGSTTPPAPSAPSAPTAALMPIAVLDAVALGVDPAVGVAVTAQLRETSRALGYEPAAPDAVRSALALLELPGAPRAPELRRIAERLGASRGVLATVRARGGTYLVTVEVGSAGRAEAWSAEARAGAGELVAVTDRLLRAALPPPGVNPPSTPPGGPAPTRTPSGSAPPRRDQTASERYRLALGGEGAFGIGAGSFTNVLAGARLDYRFTPSLSLGAGLAYANLKGRSGRESNVLPRFLLDYRVGLGEESSLFVPFRFTSGWLPNNGPVSRLSVGFGARVSERVELVFDALAPAVWVTRDKPVVSVDLSAELAISL